MIAKTLSASRGGGSTRDSLDPPVYTFNFN